MKRFWLLLSVFPIVSLIVFPGLTLNADEQELKKLDYKLDGGIQINYFSNLSLAQNNESPQVAVDQAKIDRQAKNNEIAADYKSSYGQKKTIHKYLGYSALALGVLTALTAPDGDDDDDENHGNNDRDANAKTLDGDGDDAGVHTQLAYATIVASAATVSLGIIYLNTDLSWTSAWGAENYHAVLGTLGAIYMISAVRNAPSDAHSKQGMFGGVLMGLAIALVF